MGNDLEIEIRAGATPGTYEVEVDSPAGTATGTMQLDAASILNRRRELASSVLASAVTQRSAYPTLEAPVREVGHSLFEALFADRIYGRYTASLQEAGRRGDPLRVVLRLRVPELAGIPWETLFDPETGEYLCQREPVVRYVDSAQPSAPLVATGPLRILGLVAAPRDLAALDTAEERRRLDDALGDLQEQGLVEMVWVEGGNWSALQQKLMAGPWHVLHVIGHGGVRAQGGVLALEDETTGNASLVGAARFARLLHACRPVPRLVVLNSCSSGESAADDLLSSTAAALVHSGITATVAMQFAVTDPAALAFSRGFYQAMARNIAVDEAVRLGRIAIDGTGEQTLEWVTPVVYLRGDDTRLFDLTAREQGVGDALPEEGEEISHEAAKYGLYVQALAAARKGRYDEAVALFESLSTLDPDYRDTAERRDRARRDQRLEANYTAGRAAEDAGDWETARRLYRAVLDLDPKHGDAHERHAGCERHLLVASLQDELRVHAGAEDWDAVLAVSRELTRIDPDAADPEGLATRAQELLEPAAPIPVDGDPVEELVSEEAELPTRTLLETDQPTTVDGAGGDGGDVTSDDPGDEPLDDGTGNERHGPRRKVITALAIGVPVILVAAVAGTFLLNHDGTTASSSSGAPSGQVACWDGSSAADAGSCPLPTGADGLRSVFPSMDDSCEQQNASAPGKAEVWECVYDTYTIRYSRWDDGFNKFDYFDSHIKNAETGEWTLGGVDAGRTWTGLDDRTSEERRYRAIAAYADWPYDVTVKGVEQAAMEEGVKAVQEKTPDQIGLP